MPCRSEMGERARRFQHARQVVFRKGFARRPTDRQPHGLDQGAVGKQAALQAGLEGGVQAADPAGGIDRPFVVAERSSLSAAGVDHVEREPSVVLVGREHDSLPVGGPVGFRHQAVHLREAADSARGQVEDVHVQVSVAVRAEGELSAGRRPGRRVVVRLVVREPGDDTRGDLEHVELRVAVAFVRGECEPATVGRPAGMGDEAEVVHKHPVRATVHRVQEKAAVLPGTGGVGHGATVGGERGQDAVGAVGGHAGDPLTGGEKEEAEPGSVLLLVGVAVGEPTAVGRQVRPECRAPSAGDAGQGAVGPEGVEEQPTALSREEVGLRQNPPVGLRRQGWGREGVDSIALGGRRAMEVLHLHATGGQLLETVQASGRQRIARQAQDAEGGALEEGADLLDEVVVEDEDLEGGKARQGPGIDHAVGGEVKSLQRGQPRKRGHVLDSVEAQIDCPQPDEILQAREILDFAVAGGQLRQGPGRGGGQRQVRGLERVDDSGGQSAVGKGDLRPGGGRGRLGAAAAVAAGREDQGGGNETDDEWSSHGGREDTSISRQVRVRPPGPSDRWKPGLTAGLEHPGLPGARSLRSGRTCKQAREPPAGETDLVVKIPPAGEALRASFRRAFPGNLERGWQHAARSGLSPPRRPPPPRARDRVRGGGRGRRCGSRWCRRWRCRSGGAGRRW